MELPVYEPGTKNHIIALFAVYKIMPPVSLAVFTTYLIYLSLSWVSIRFLFFGVFLAYLLEPTMCRAGILKTLQDVCVCVCCLLTLTASRLCSYQLFDANENCVMAFIKLYSYSHHPVLILCRQVQI